MLDHLLDLEQDVLERAVHPGEAAVVSAAMDRFRESVQWQSKSENISPGMLNRYIVIVAMGDAVVDQRCDVHELCGLVQELVPRLLPDYSLHCRVLSTTAPTGGLQQAIAPKILTGQVGASAGIVVLDGYPPALEMNAEPGVLAHELGHLLPGLIRMRPRTQVQQHRVEHLADAVGVALVGPWFTRDLPRYFLRRPRGASPLWGTHPGHSDRLGFLEAAVPRITNSPEFWGVWALNCLKATSLTADDLRMPGTQALKYLDPHHPFLQDLVEVGPGSNEFEQFGEHDFAESVLGGMLKNATDCKPDFT